MMKRVAMVAVALCLTSAVAVAQESSPQGGNAAAPTSLSNKLSETGGVIKPKTDIDPGIHATAPDPHPNSTPVIPPSATGGNTAK